jgi:hypothetical protein
MIIANALDKLSNLMQCDRVVIGPEYDTALSATIDAVRVNVTGCPFDRDVLISALGDPNPFDWETSVGDWFRDWRGVLLTMPVVVYEQLPPPSAVVEAEPPARDPAGDIGIVEGNTADEQRDNAAARYDADEAEFVPSPSPVPTCLGARGGFEADCGEPGPHGAHPLGDEPPFEVVIATIDGPTVVVRPSAPMDEGWAEGAGLEPADAQHWADPKTAEAWRRYAVARARVAFNGQRFTTPTAAVAALDAWKGRTMLTDGDVAQLAGELLEIPPAPNPSEPRPFVVRLFRPRRTGRHGVVQLVEHVTASGPVA